MRIISGTYKGRRLKGGKDLSIRPATDRVKEYIFNILREFPQGAQVFDIFSGSGGLGLEALSRGAQQAVFVEKAYSSIQVLTENLSAIKVPQSKYRIVQKDALVFARSETEKADLCFMDPPYKYPPLQELIDAFFFNRQLKQRGILVLEHETINPIQKESPLYNLFLQKKISRSLISFLEYKEEDE